MNAFLNKILEYLLELLPVWLIFADEGGIFLRGGRYRATLKPGIYFKIPLLDRIWTIKVIEQTVNLPNQSVTTRDGKTLAVSGAVRYEIEDAKKALLSIYNYDTSIQNIAMATIASVISRTPYSDCKYDFIAQEAFEELQAEAEGWGIEIDDVWLTDLVVHKAYRLMMADVPVPV